VFLKYPSLSVPTESNHAVITWNEDGLIPMKVDNLWSFTLAKTCLQIINMCASLFQWLIAIFSFIWAENQEQVSKYIT